MSSDGDTDYEPNYLLTKEYRKVCDLDEDVLESLCPSYASLSADGDRYEDEELLGEGALKLVFRTYDKQTERCVAMARLREDRGIQFYDHFVREARLVASLSHPNIIKVHDAGVDAEERPFFTMDLKGNTSLADLIEQRDSTPQLELLEVFSKICDAVAYAHSQGVIHLDLKPENIQCDQFGEVLVCDWGLGLMLGKSEPRQNKLMPREELEEVTLTGEVKGSLGYMAPEQAIPVRVKDERTDVYALGCILHAILCGEPPFTGSKEEVLKNTETAEVVPPSTRFSQLTIAPSLEAVVMKATAKVPNDRYQSVLQLQQEIQKYMGGFSTDAENSGFVREASLFLRRNSIPASIIFAAVIVLTVLVVLFVQSLEQERMATAEERQRAERILDEKTTMSTEHATIMEESILSKKELAVRLTVFERRFLYEEFFDEPVESTLQAWKILDFVRRLNPDEERARVARFHLETAKMNFYVALRDGSTALEKTFDTVPAMVQAFPKYNFGSEKRPSLEQFRAFIEKAYEIDPKQHGTIERIFAYHAAVQPYIRKKPEYVSLFLGYFCGYGDNCSVDYNVKTASLNIKSDQRLRLLYDRPHASKLCLLRFFNVKQLTLETDKMMYLSSLDLSHIMTLDVSRCKELSIEAPLFLPKLKHITIREGQITEGEIRAMVSANREFEVIVK